MDTVLTGALQAFVDGVSQFVLPHGFVWRKRSQEWYRKTDSGSDGLHLNVARVAGALEVLVSIHVRIDDIERLVKPGVEDGATIGTALENVAGLLPRSRRIASVEEGVAAAVEVNKLMQSHGLGFLVDHGSPVAILSMLTSGSAMAAKCSPINVYKSMTVCAALWVLGRKDEVPQAVESEMASLRRGDRERLLAFAGTLQPNT
jgi:hypothetical protein